MKVVVTGGAGYLGSVLVPKLVARGHEVRIVDLGYFGLGHLKGLTPPVPILREDLRTLARNPALGADLTGWADCIIHLAAISNDPSADLHPDLTDEVNVGVTARLADLAKRAGVRFIFSSSCSIYGEADGLIDESGAVNPLTVYARSKVAAERVLEQLADGSWSPVILRNGTLFGHSSRMRFDLVVNIFSLYSTLHNEIKVFGDGQQWRPFLHVADCARAFVHFLETPSPDFTVYNIAHENLRVVDLVDMFRRLNPALRVQHVPTPDVDRRDYRVSNRRMLDAGFRPRVGVELGAEDMIDAIVSGLVPDPESVFYRNAKWLKELTQIGSKDHRDLIGLLETIRQVAPAAGPK
jgi:nucleoside-diphosphate-sugar epimerase